MSVKTNKVDFLVIGAGKAGTTWVWEILRKHPDCCLPEEKEINYFNKESPENNELINHNYGKPIFWYHDFFNRAQSLSDNSSALWGEVSPGYLWSKNAAKDIHEYNSNMKLLVILRDPVERSFSHYLYRKQRGLTSEKSFESAVREDQFLVDRSFYGKCLVRYLKIFPSSQLKILFFDDVKNNPQKVMQEMFEFLGVKSIDLSLEKINETGAPKHPRLVRLMGLIELSLKKYGIFEQVQHFARKVGLAYVIRQVRGSLKPFEQKPVISSDFDELLRAQFVSDIEIVEKISGRNLELWKRHKSS